MSEFDEPKDVNGYIEVTGAERTHLINRSTFKEMLLKVAKEYADSLGNRDTAARALNAFAAEHGLADPVAQESLVGQVFPAVLVWFENSLRQPKARQRGYFHMAYREFLFHLHSEGRQDA